MANYTTECPKHGAFPYSSKSDCPECEKEARRTPMIDEIKKRNEERRVLANVCDPERQPLTAIEIINEHLPEAYDDIDKLIGVIERVTGWIDNPHFTHVQKLHRIEVEVRGMVKAKGGQDDNR